MRKKSALVVVRSNADADAIEIGRLYRKARTSIAESVKCLVEAGQRLIAKKDSLNHGEWLPWLAVNAEALGFTTPRTAQFLMKAGSKYEANFAFEDTEAFQISRKIWGNHKRGLTTGVAMDPYAERGLDLYQTPPAAVRALLDVEPLPLSATIWEPACGPGNIVRVLRAAGHRVHATDLRDYGCEGALGGVDFLAQESALKGAEIVLTNPPFMHADEFVRHALRLVPRAIFLLRLVFIESVGRSDILDGGQLARIYPFANRLPMMHRHGWDGPEASSALALAWFVWDREHRGPIELQRIEWTAEPDEAVRYG